jgi:hypothetical protein
MEPSTSGSNSGVGSFARQHPAVLLTGCYLYLSLIGGLYNFALFREFDVNVFRHAKAEDFLIAAFADPLTIPLGVLSSLIALFAVRFIDWVEKVAFHMPPKRVLNAAGWAILCTMWVPYYAFEHGQSVAREIRQLAPTIEVKLKAGTDRGDVTPPIRGKLIGRVGQLIFILDPTAQQVIGVPESNLSDLRIPVSRGVQGPEGVPRK